MPFLFHTCKLRGSGSFSSLHQPTWLFLQALSNFHVLMLLFNTCIKNNECWVYRKRKYTYLYLFDVCEMLARLRLMGLHKAAESKYWCICRVKVFKTMFSLDRIDWKGTQTEPKIIHCQEKKYFSKQLECIYRIRASLIIVLRVILLQL